MLHCQFRFLFLIFAVGIGVSGRVFGDIDLPTVPPPQPSPHQVEISEGETIEIPLRGVARGGGQLRFLVRSTPNLGTLSEVTVTGTNTAVVRYTHDATSGFGTDTFRYAVQGPGTGVSAPAEVKVVVRDRPPVFAAPARLDFPDVPLGEKVRETLVIRNDGGGRIVGTLTVPEPWALVGESGEYMLGADETREFVIEFSPAEARQHAATGEFSHAQGVLLGLGGRAFRPVEVVPNKVELRLVPGSQIRTGEVVVRNLTEVEKVFSVKAPAELVIADVVAVPAGEEVALAMQTRSGFLGFLEGEVEFVGDGLELKVPVRVPSAPARLVVDLPDGAKFGDVIRGETSELKVVVRNTGGTEARVRASAADGVTVKSESSFETLAPGESRDYTVAVRVFEVGDFERVIRFDADSASADVRLTGSGVVDPREAELAKRRQREPVVSNVAAGVDLESLNSIEPPEEIRVVSVTEEGFDLEWDGPEEGGVRDYAISARQFDFKGDGEVEVVWKPLAGAKLKIADDGVVKATIRGLHPGERLTIAVQAVDNMGKKSRSSLPFEMRTRAREQWQFPWTLATVIAMAGLIAVIVRERRRQRAESNAEVQEAIRRL